MYELNELSQRGDPDSVVTVVIFPMQYFRIQISFDVRWQELQVCLSSSLSSFFGPVKCP